jgi:predicted nucleic acid-binding protein
MEPASLGAILDSSVVIEAERRHLSVAQLLKRIVRSTGEMKAALPVYPITDGTPELVVRIGAESAASGVTIPFDDLLIGVSALERGYAVATRNLRHFQKIPGLNLISL